MSDSEPDPPDPLPGASAARQTHYANATRVFGTPEEVVCDFGMNVNMFGKVVDEPAAIDQRMVLSYYSAKRLALMLSQVIRGYESKYGTIELDPRKRLDGPGEAP